MALFLRHSIKTCVNPLQVLIYHGANDIICHFPGAQEMLAQTNWTGKDQFHQSERRALWVYNEVLKSMVEY